MSSEARRGLIRIISNYGRLGTTVVLGLILVPVLFRGIGKEGYGLSALIGSTVGFAQMFREIVRYSMNRELGAAYHSDDPALFRSTYNSAIVISGVLALLAAGFFLVIFFIVPVLNIPDNLIWPARWAALAGGINTFSMVLLGPQYNMFMVTERMAIYNAFTAAERIGYVGSAVVLFLVLGMGDPENPGRGFILFSIFANATSILVLLSAVVLILRIEPGLWPDLSTVTRRSIRSIVATSGWNALTATAMNLHIRLDALIVNLSIGVLANAAFGMAVTLTGYVRMLAVGMTDGLDVVAARMSTRDQQQAVARLVHHSTRLHAFVALPAGLAVFVLAKPILTIWIAHRAPGAADLIPTAVPIVQLLIIGFTARAISDNWVRILYGAGYVARYAPLILVGGLLNPILAISLIAVLPDRHDILGPAFAFATILMLLHLLGLPIIGARCLNVRYRDLLMPILRPTLVTAASSPILIAASSVLDQWTLLHLFVVMLVFGVVYLSLTIIFVLSPDERSRFLAAATRRFHPSRG